MTTGTLTNGTSTDLYKFTATKGQKFYLDGQGDTDYNGYYTIYNPNNGYVTNQYFGFDREFTAPADGTYLLAVQGYSEESVDYSFNLITPETTATQNLTIGETVTGNIAEVGEEDLYTFTGTVGQKLYFDGIDSSSSIYAYLTSPSGENISSSWYLGSDSNPITLTENGIYQLKIDGSGNATGDYSFRVLDIADATELALDTVTTGTLTNGTSTDLYQFTATKGQKFYLDGQGDTYNGTYYIYSPSNNYVTNQTFGFDREFTAPADGTYLLAVQGYSEESVDYSFNLITPETTATQNLTIGETVTGNIAEAGEEDLYTFTGTVGQKLYFDGISNEANANAYLTSPSGENISSSWYLGSDSNPITLTESGTYQLKIDNSGDNTGNYSFRVLDLANANELELDTVTTGTLTNGTSTDLYKFTATKGQKFYLDGQGATDYNGYYTIYNPNNGSVINQYFGFDREFTVSADGTYLLAVQGNSDAAVDYSFNLVTPETTATQNLTIGQTITSNIAEAGEEDLYTFTGTVGQKLYFDGISNEANAYAYLTSPSGENISSSWYLGSDSNPITLRESGTYQLKIDNSGDNTGNYSFRLLDLANASEFNLDETVSGTLAAETTASFKFDAQAGQTLSLDGMGTQYGGSYIIYSSGNSYIASQSFGFDTEFTITRDGTYYLLAQSYSSEAVNYSFLLSETAFEEPTPVVTTPLTLGNTVTGSIAQANENDTYTFTGTAGQKVYFDGISGNSNIDARLISPSGETLNYYYQNVNGDSEAITLTENGTYELVIDGYSTTTGDYSFRLLDAASANELTLDTVTTGTTASNSTNLYKFTATKGQKFYLDGQGTTGSGTYYIYPPNNSYVAGTTFGYDTEFTAPADGAYLLAAQSYSNAAVNYSFNLITAETSTQTLTLGETVTGNLSKAGEEDIYTFTGSAGQKLYFDGIAGDYQIDARLISPSGTNLNYYYQNVNSDSQPVNLTENGTYQVVVDGNSSITGDYSFRLLDLADATTLTLDTVTTGTTASNSTNLYQFTATKGQKFYLDGQGTTNYNGYYTIYSPNNQSVTGQYFSFDTEFTAPADGAYLLTAQSYSQESVNYSFNLITPEITTKTLTLDQTVTGNLGELGEENIYTFTASKGQKLYFDGIAGNSSINASLTTPSGQNIISSSVSSDRNPLTITESGTYQLKIDGSGSITGDYSFRLLNTANATALSLDTVTTGTLTNGRSTDLYEFTATKGQKFYLDGQGTTYNGTYYIYSPTSSYYIAGQTFGFDTEFTAPSDGTYLLAAQGSSNAAVDYSFNLITPTIENAGSLTLGQTVSNSISEAGEEDIYTFTANAGQTLYFDGISGNSSIYAYLTSPSGQNLFSFQSLNSNRNPVTLTENGTYQLRIDGNGLTTGNYSFLLSDTNQAPELNFNSTIANTLAANTSKVFRFSGTKGQNISFDDLGSQSGGTYRLFGPGNQAITSRSFPSDFEVTLPGAGTYTLILDNSSSNPINYSFRVV